MSPAVSSSLSSCVILNNCPFVRVVKESEACWQSALWIVRVFEESKVCWQSPRSVFSCAKKKRWVGYSLCVFAPSWPKNTTALWVRLFIRQCRFRASRSWYHRSLIRYLSIVQFVPLWAIRLKQLKLWLLHQVSLSLLTGSVWGFANSKHIVEGFPQTVFIHSLIYNVYMHLSNKFSNNVLEAGTKQKGKNGICARSAPR